VVRHRINPPAPAIRVHRMGLIAPCDEFPGTAVAPQGNSMAATVGSAAAPSVPVGVKASQPDHSPSPAR